MRRACPYCRAGTPPGWQAWCTHRGPHGPQIRQRISPRWLDRLGITIDRLEDQAGPAPRTTRAGKTRNVLAVTGALFVAVAESAITHALLILVTVAAVTGLVALLALAGRRRPPGRRRVLIPAPDPELTARAVTTVTSATVLPVKQAAGRAAHACSGPQRGLNHELVHPGSAHRTAR
jgi:hypothetical protein